MIQKFDMGLKIIRGLMIQKFDVGLQINGGLVIKLVIFLKNIFVFARDH